MRLCPWCHPSLLVCFPTHLMVINSYELEWLVGTNIYGQPHDSKNLWDSYPLPAPGCWIPPEIRPMLPMLHVPPWSSDTILPFHHVCDLTELGLVESLLVALSHECLRSLSFNKNSMASVPPLRYYHAPYEPCISQQSKGRQNAKNWLPRHGFGEWDSLLTIDQV